MMLGLALLGLWGQVPPTPPGFVLESLPAPFEYVVTDGWILVGDAQDGDMVVLVQPSRQRGKIWARFEYLAASEGGRLGVRSHRTLFQVDCDGWRTRALQTDFFAKPNLTGASETQGADVQWQYAGPGTFADDFLKMECTPPA